MSTTGHLIYEARRAAKLTQAEVADRLNVTNFLVCHWEKNRKPVTDMASLAKVLGTTVEAITGDEPAPVAAPVKVSEPLNLPPPPETLERFIGISDAARVFGELMKKKPAQNRIHEWVQTMGLPAYINKLKKNPQGEPTLLFLRSELIAWFHGTLRPVHAVNQ